MNEVDLINLLLKSGGDVHYTVPSRPGDFWYVEVYHARKRQMSKLRYDGSIEGRLGALAKLATEMGVLTEPEPNIGDLL